MTRSSTRAERISEPLITGSTVAAVACGAPMEPPPLPTRDAASAAGHKETARRRQRPVVGPDQAGGTGTDADGRPLAHRRVHRIGRLLPLLPRGEITARGGPAANAEDGQDP